MHECVICKKSFFYGYISNAGLCMNFHIYSLMISFMVLFLMYLCAFISILSEIVFRTCYSVSHFLTLAFYFLRLEPSCRSRVVYTVQHIILYIYILLILLEVGIQKTVKWFPQ